MAGGSPRIGGKYEARKAELRERIRAGTISSLETAVEDESHKRGIWQFGCYFCGKKIIHSMYVLEEVKYVKGDKESKATYYVDSCCFHDAKRTQYVGNTKIHLN